ncbi:histidine phosphatase family protein [Chloroflexota bacterium]
MVEIILVRHGETEWNLTEIFRGTIDVGLNETGIKQAELLGEFMKGLKIEAIFSSPLKRALMTAEPVARNKQLQIETVPALIDLNFGKWQGLPVQEVRDKYEELYSDWVNHPESVEMPDGENLNYVRKRALALIDRLTVEYHGTVVLVSHRVVNKVLICALLGLDNSHFWNIQQDTCGITTFAFEKGRFILTGHNNTSFLQSISNPQLNDF